MVLQVEQELESREVIESGYPDGPVAYRKGRSGQATARHWNAT